MPTSIDETVPDAPEQPHADPGQRMRARRDQPFDAALGARIRALRIAAKMSQGALGQAVGVKFQQVQKYETGKDRLSASTLKAVADALRVSPRSLYEDMPQSPVVANGTGDTRTKIVRLFQQIDDPQLRKRLMEFIKALAPDAAPGRPT